MKFFFALLLSLATAFGQGKITGRIQNFQANPAPGGKRTFIKGADYRDLGGGVILITTPHVETFKLDGSADMIIDATESFFDQGKSNDVWSDKDLSTRSADGRIALQGVGFRWRAIDSQLSISNRVEAILTREKLVTGAAASTNIIRVTSDQMNYTAELVIFSGNVYVIDAQGEIRCQTLRVHFDQENTPYQIEAIDEVILTHRGTVARGKRALYTRATGLLRLTENTTWEMGDRDGESESLIIDRTNDTIRAEIQVRMTLPSSLINTNAAAANTNKVTISADTFDYAPTNRITQGPIAIYNGNVHANDPQANLDCELLTIYFGPSNRVVRAVAERAVQITRPLTSVRGEKAVFENEEITVTGEPAWRHEEKSGTSEILVFNPRTGEIRAVQVRMEIPFASGTNSLFGVTQTAALKPTIALTNILLVTSKYFTNKEKLATFAENVRAIEPRGQIDANLVNVYFNATNRPTRITADGDVVLTEAKSQALGQRADFNLETGLIRLTGVPKVLNGTNYIIASEIIFNRNTGKVKYLPPFLGELTQGTNRVAR